MILSVKIEIGTIDINASLSLVRSSLISFPITYRYITLSCNSIFRPPDARAVSISLSPTHLGIRLHLSHASAS